MRKPFVLFKRGLRLATDIVRAALKERPKTNACAKNFASRLRTKTFTAFATADYTKKLKIN